MRNAERHSIPSRKRTPARYSRCRCDVKGTSAFVDDDVMIARLGIRRVLVGMRPVGRERNRIARAKLEDFGIHAQPKLSGQYHQHFVRSWSVRLRSVNRSRRQAKLVQLDDGRGPGRGQRPAFELAVSGSEDLRVRAAQDSRSRTRRPDELCKRDTETHRNLPKHSDRRVTLASLNLRKGRTAYSRGTRQVIERKPAGLTTLPQILGHTTAKVSGTDVVSRTGQWAIGPARRQVLFHFSRRSVHIQKDTLFGKLIPVRETSRATPPACVLSCNPAPLAAGRQRRLAYGS